jgi:hypothetical protein
MSTTVDYLTEKLIGGNIVSAVKKASATDFFAGQLLGRTDSTGVYGPYNAGGADGLQNVRAVCIETRTLASAGALSVYITGTEVQSGGLVDNAGDPLTVTTAIIEAAQDGGIVVKEY